MLVTDPNSNIEIVEKFSRVVETESRILRVDGFDLDVIKVQAVSPKRLRVLGVAPGVSSVVLTDELGKALTVSVLVKGDTRHLQAIINQRYPNAKIETYKVGDAVVLTGEVSEPQHTKQIVEIAEQFYPQVLKQLRINAAEVTFEADAPVDLAIER